MKDVRFAKLNPEDTKFAEATLEDIEELSALAHRSKRHWGYSKEAMELWNQNLTITPEFLDSHTVIKAVLGNEIVGFFALEDIKSTTRIAQYWIDTPYMRKGYGTVMYNYMRSLLRKQNVEKVTLVLDPNGLYFFKNKGARILDKIEHKVKNKFLYIVEVPVN